MSAKKMVFLPAVLGCFLFPGPSRAQHLERTLLSTAGMSNDLEWSVGEVVVGDFSAGGYRLTLGFHQGTGLIDQVLQQGVWNHRISLFPNPSTRDLWLEKDDTEAFQLKVFDVQGALMREEVWTGISKQLNVRPWNAGMYLIFLMDEQGAYAVYTFIKQ